MVYFTYLFTNTQFFIRLIIQCGAGPSLLNMEGSDAMMADDYSKKQLNDTPPMYNAECQHHQQILRTCRRTHLYNRQAVLLTKASAYRLLLALKT